MKIKDDKYKGRDKNMKKVYKILIIAGCAAVAAVIMFVNVSSGDPPSPVTALQVTQEEQPSDSQPMITAMPESTGMPPADSASPSSSEATGDAPTASIQTSPKPSSPASKESETNSSASSGVDTSTGSTSTLSPTTAPTPQPTATSTPTPAASPTGAPTPCPSGDEQQTIDDTRDWIEDNQPTPAPPDPDLPGIGNW
jgi:hypothetical protein